MNVNALKNPYVSFKSRIEFVDKCKFSTILSENGFNFNNEEELSKKTNYSGYPWNIEQAVKSKTSALTDRLYVCSAVGVTNSDEVFLSHLVPHETISPKIKPNLEKEILNLKKQDKNVKALLIGGMPVLLSKNLFKHLFSIIKEAKIPKTIIWGQKKNEFVDTAVFYSVKKKTWYIFNSLNIKSEEELKNAYKCIKIADGDELYINDKRVNNASVYKDEDKLLN